MTPIWRLTSRSTPGSWLARSPRGRWRSSQEASRSSGRPSRRMRAAPTCRRNTDARWSPPPGSLPARCPRCCRSPPHSVALLVAVSAWVPTRHPAGAVRAVLTVLEEEVQALRRAAGTAGALTQEPRPAQPGGRLIQDPVELTSISSASAASSGQVTRPCWTGPPSVRRSRGPGLAAGPGCRAAFRAAVIRGGRDGEHVTGGADGEPEGTSWPWPADAAGRDRVAQRPRVRPGGACHLLPEYVGRSVPGLPCPQPGQARHAHRHHPREPPADQAHPDLSGDRPRGAPLTDRQ